MGVYDALKKAIEKNPDKTIVFDVNRTLTAKEFDLLMLFVNNRGTAFPRDQILGKIWEENYYGSDRVVDDHLVGKLGC